MAKTNFQARDAIRDAIRQIALKGIVNSTTGAVVGTGKIIGYVSKIHDNPLDPLFGTIDVQEYTQLAMDEGNEMKMGLHEGVYIGSLQDNSSGFVIVPLMYSDVVVDRDADTGQEYVSMFSHVQHVQIDSHEDVVVGVKERVPFDPVSEDAPDVHQLPATGTSSTTTYTKDSITSESKALFAAGSKQELTPSAFSLSVAGGLSSVGVDAFKAKVERGAASVEVSSDAIEVKVGAESVKTTASGVEVGGREMEPAVLGSTLLEMLSQLLSILSSAMTTTMLGPQPLIPAGQLAALQSKLKPFLSQHVKIQK